MGPGPELDNVTIFIIKAIRYKNKYNDIVRNIEKVK